VRRDRGPFGRFDAVERFDQGQPGRSLMTLALLTGYPGFIGRRLAAHLLEDRSDIRMAALVEPRMMEAAREAAGDQERLELIAGDIAEPRLGLDEKAYRRLTSEVTHVFHLAAIYNLAVPLAVATRVNVGGTGNVLDLCLAADGLERLAYVSTAYVAGTRTGVVYEHELVMGQGFKNHYESTKFQAEVWVRDAMDRVPTTILRPAIVVGDSVTGETQKFDGPYYILRTISRMERAGRPVPQFGRSEALFNVVPVDYIVAAIAASAFDPATAGETLHLTDPEPLQSHELFEALSEAYAGRAPRHRIPPSLVEASLRVRPIREAFGGTPRESVVYLNHPVAFDARRAIELLTPLGLRPPNFRAYVGAIVEFFRQHEDDPALAPG
jgi:thioester reductase-like protein